MTYYAVHPQKHGAYGDGDGAIPGSTVRKFGIEISICRTKNVLVIDDGLKTDDTRHRRDTPYMNDFSHCRTHGYVSRYDI